MKQLVLKPTVYCYHRCPYCGLRQDYYRKILASRKVEHCRNLQNNDTQNPGHMPLHMALGAIDEAAALGMTALQLSGGDPLLYPHLTDLIQAGARHPDVFVFMNSVGAGVSLKKAREIIGAGLGAWNFSVDTLDARKFDRLRGKVGAFRGVMQALKTVRKAATAWPDFCINIMSVITRHSFRDIPDLLRYSIDTGVASIYLMNVYGDTTGEALLNEKEISEFRERVVPSMLSIIKGMRLPEEVYANAALVLANFFSDDNSDTNYARGLYWPNIDAVKQACRAPDYYALVEPDGRVLPCCLVEIAHEGEVGSIATHTLTEIWNGARYASFRRDRIPFCLKCSAPRHMTLGLIPKMCRQFNG